MGGCDGRVYYDLGKEFNFTTSTINSARNPAGTNPVTRTATHKIGGTGHERTIAKPKARQTARPAHHKGLWIVYQVIVRTSTAELDGRLRKKTK